MPSFPDYAKHMWGLLCVFIYYNIKREELQLQQFSVFDYFLNMKFLIHQYDMCFLSWTD